jgi:hypothetical protein
MTTGVVVWLGLAAFFGALYFAIAAVVSLKGVGDLRRLLRGAEVRRKGSETTQRERSAE